MPKEPLYPHVPKSVPERSPSLEEYERKLRERSLHEVHTLVLQLLYPALESVKGHEYNSALWRLVDAAGLLSTVSDKAAIGTRGHATGYGYYIAKE